MKNKVTEKKKSISERFVDQLYDMDFQVKDEQGKDIEITDKGFLGLLATGYKGLVILRKKRATTHLYSKFTKGKKPIQHKRNGKNKPKE